MEMIDSAIQAISSISKELAVFVTAALPVSELRGAIPLAILSFKFSALKAYVISFMGNALPVVPILLLLGPISGKLRKFPLWKKFFDWLFEHTKKKASLVEKFEAVGLILFVAIPLPITGAWTGCIAATLFKIRFRYAFFAILAGIAIAGIVVTVLTLAGQTIVNQ